MKADEMGRTPEELLAWMREVAIARDDHAGKHRTVTLKFTTATLRMWLQRVDDAIGLPSAADVRGIMKPPAGRADVFLDEDPARTLVSISTMLGWLSPPPRRILEAEIRALKARAASQPGDATTERKAKCGDCQDVGIVAGTGGEWSPIICMCAAGDRVRLAVKEAECNS